MEKNSRMDGATLFCGRKEILIKSVAQVVSTSVYQGVYAIT
jgi:hypothetical protein